MSKIDWNPKLDSFNNYGDISFKFYNSSTGEVINLNDICNNSTMIAKIPIIDINLDKLEYGKYIDKGFNIYNARSEFYIDPCLALQNDTSKGDIVLNDRRSELYKNISFTCGNNCEFVKIDENNYSICLCNNTTQTLKAKIENEVFGRMNYFETLIVVCAKNFNWVKI